MGGPDSNMEGKHVLLGVVCAALAMASTASKGSNDHISAKNPAMCAPEGDLDCESPCNNFNRTEGAKTRAKYPLRGQPYKKAHEQCKDSDWTKTLMFWKPDSKEGNCVCRQFDGSDPMSTTMVAATATKEDFDKSGLNIKLQTISGKSLSKVMLKAFTLHPHKASQNVGLFGLKRTVCFEPMEPSADTTCSTYKVGQCLNCPLLAKERRCPRDKNGQLHDDCKSRDKYGKVTRCKTSNGCRTGFTRHVFHSVLGTLETMDEKRLFIESCAKNAFNSTGHLITAPHNYTCATSDANKAAMSLMMV